MGSIGPQLPPHLAKRKRSAEDDGAPASRPAKAAKGANPNEINLGDESSDDDNYGPSRAIGPSRPKEGPPSSRPSIGPTIPPEFSKNTDEIDLSDDDDTPLGPTLPISASVASKPSSPPPAKRSIGPTLPPARPSNPAEISLSNSDSDSGPGAAPPPSTSRRTYGPSLPPSTTSSHQHPADSDSDSDDYGPAPPSASNARPSLPSRMPEETAPEPTKRDDWMLAPPTATGYRATDPTKLKNRSFRSGPSAASAAQNSGVPSIWTETAQEKLARLQNSVLGRGPDSGPSGASGGAAKAAQESERRRKIEEYTAQTRGKSMYEERREARRAGKLKTDEEEDDPSKRPFDREKDMAIGGRLGAAQKRELMNKASNFGDRFQKGSYL